MGWYFFGEQNVKYLFGTRGVTPYRVVVMCFIVMGSLLQVNLVWELADMFNGLMAFPNLIGLIMLTPVVKAETLAYLRSLKKEPASEG